VDERSLKFLCRTHNVAFDGRVPGAIVCETGREVLASDFPRDKRWAYCCDCQCFWTLGFDSGGSKAEKKCPSCDDEIRHWYLCDRCAFVTVETEKKPADGKPFTFGGELGPNSCPGCLKEPVAALREHICYRLSVDGDEAADGESVIVHITMALKTCPFCGCSTVKRPEAAGARPAGRAQKSADASTAAAPPADERQTPAAPSVWQRLWPTFRHRWMELATAAGLLLGVLGVGLSAFAYAFPTAPLKLYTTWKRWVNRPPRVLDIKCGTEVFEGKELILNAIVDDDDKLTLSYHWTTSEGWIEWNGAEAKLMAVNIKPLTVPVPVTVIVTVTDESGAQTSGQKTVHVTTPTISNKRPSIEGITPVPGSAVQVGDSITLDASVSDPDGDNLNFRWHTTDGQILGAGRRVTLTTSGINPQGGTPIVATVTLNVEDGRGEPATKDIRINIYQKPAEVVEEAGAQPTPPIPLAPTPSKNPPEISSLQVDKTPVQAGEEVTVEAEVHEPNGDKLVYEWQVPELGIQRVNNSSRFTFKTADFKPLPGGSRLTVYLWVRDEHKNQDSKHVTIRVLPLPPTPTPTPAPPPAASPTPADTPARAPEVKTPPEKGSGVGRRG